MKKYFYTAQTITLKETFMKKLRTGVMITFMFTATVAGAAPIEQRYEVERDLVTTERIATVTAKSTQTKDTIPIDILADSCSNLEYNTMQAYNCLVGRCPKATEMENVMRFVTEGIGDIDAERVVMDCDLDSKVFNVSYKLQDDMLLSISKPSDTMDDSFVMFNVYHKKELLLSDSASIELLSEYIHNVEDRIKELA